jgi:hypothetical protein
VLGHHVVRVVWLLGGFLGGARCLLHGDMLCTCIQVAV